VEAAARIAFDATEYDKLLTVMGALINDMSDSPTRDGGVGPAPLDGGLLLQPDGQTWQPAVDLVSAGQAFGDTVHTNTTTLLHELEAFHDALCAARGVFSKAGDLARLSAESFRSDYPMMAPDAATNGGAQ
jgi:hypothetical protein